MDTIAHGLMGIAITYIAYWVLILLIPALVYSPFSLIMIFIWILSFLLGAIPDIAGVLDGWIRGKEYRWNGWYGYFHYPELYPTITNKKLFKILLSIPHIKLHTEIIDRKTHNTIYNPAPKDFSIFGIKLVTKNATTGWNLLGYKLTILFWVPILIFIII